jgi:integrase
VHFTKDNLDALVLPAGKREHFEWDPGCPGFGVRLRGDRRTWVVQYRVDRQQRRETLGDLRRVPLEAARKAARQRFAQATLGVDMAAERAKRRLETAQMQRTLGEVTDLYLAAKVDTFRPSTFNQAKRYFESHWKPLRNRPIDTIKRADIAARLQEIINANGRIAAARARENLAALFSWATGEALFDAVNPVSHTNDPAAGIKPRERVLDDDELAAVWRACGNDNFGKVIRLLILTGCRRNEIAALRWDEINLDTGLLTISGERTKNRRALLLPLPVAAVDILRSVPRQQGTEFVFGRNGPFKGFSYATLNLTHRAAEELGRPLAHWCLHDLRRSMRTGLGKIGIRPDVAEMTIGHVRGGIVAVYDKYSYQPEIKTALAWWADRVLAVVEGRERKVVPLRA